jgi:hypothetical protein
MGESSETIEVQAVEKPKSKSESRYSLGIAICLFLHCFLYLKKFFLSILVD